MTWFRKHARLIRVALVVAVLIAAAFPVYSRFFRGTWDLRAPAAKILFRGREYRYGREATPGDIEDVEKTGDALWPDGEILTNHEGAHSPYVPTGIVVESPARSGRFRSYGLVGGP
jgi:hypothetical protein